MLKKMNWSEGSVSLDVKDRKYFTVGQANKSLVLLQRIVGEIIQEYGNLLELEEMIESAERSNRGDRLELFRRRLVNSVDVLQACLEELELIGVELRDFTRGIVDFPAWHDGREIRLCWMFGERAVANWHERDSGFACRRSIALLERSARPEPSPLG